MRSSFKGAVSTVAALVLLAGGAGTLSYWSAERPVGGTDIDAGRLALLAGSGCGAWQLAHKSAAAVPLAADDLLVPGDVLTRSCSFEVAAEGENLAASISVADPGFTGGDFGGELTASLGPVLVDGAVRQGNLITSDDDGASLDVDVRVVWADLVAGNSAAHMGATTVLDDVAVVATQVAP